MGCLPLMRPAARGTSRPPAECGHGSGYKESEKVGATSFEPCPRDRSHAPGASGDIDGDAPPQGQDWEAVVNRRHPLAAWLVHPGGTYVSPW